MFRLTIINKINKHVQTKKEKNDDWTGWTRCHSPVKLQWPGSTLTLQQASPLPHGHLTSVLSGVQVDWCVIHWRLRRNEDRGRGGGRVRAVMRRRRWWRRGRWRGRTGVCGGRGEGRRWRWDEGSECWLWRKVITVSTAPISSRVSIGGRGGGAGMGWWRRMGEGHWF